MTLVLTDKGQELLDDIQPEVADDPCVQMAEQALANELDRIEAAATALRDGFFPAQATDPQLSLLEDVFGLPINPAALTLAQRRQLVLAHFQKRIAGAGSDWEAAVTKAMGTTDYTYFEGPLPNQVTIEYAFSPGAPTASAVQAYVRAVTPAHVRVLATYTGGFLIGISLIGDPL